MKGGYLKNAEYIMVELFDTFSYEPFSKKLVTRIKEKTFNTLVITKLLNGSVSIYTGHISQYLNKCVESIIEVWHVSLCIFKTIIWLCPKVVSMTSQRAHLPTRKH